MSYLKTLYNIVALIMFHVVSAALIWKLLTVALPATIVLPFTFLNILAFWTILVLIMFCCSVMIVSVFRAASPNQKIIAEIVQRKLPQSVDNFEE